MKDTDFTQFNDLLFNSLIDNFSLDFENEENLKKYGQKNLATISERLQAKIGS